MIEVWNIVPGHESYYASNTGIIKSFKNGKERILKPWNNKGYLYVELDNKPFAVHQIITMVFFGHKPDGKKTHVRHLDGDKTNNNIDNLAVGSPRENAHDEPIRGSSKYRGVGWNKNTKKWRAKIEINKKSFHLGLFNTEVRASIAFQFALFQLDKLKDIL